MLARALACLLPLLLTACGDDGSSATDDSGTTSGPATETSGGPTSSTTDATSGTTSATATSSTSTSGNTDSASSDTGTGSGDTGTGDTGTGDTGTGGAAACYADAEAQKPAPGTSVQETWGSACQTNADCEALLGAGALCEQVAVVFELPGGYCTKPCVVGNDPNDTNVTFELDDAECDPNGGVMCLGVNGIWARCAVPCNDSSQCTREGYFCQLMPVIGAQGDPMACLMDECCEDSCEG